MPTTPDDPRFLGRALANELTDDEASAFRRWLAEDPVRREEFRQLERAWIDAGRVRHGWDAETALAAIKARDARGTGPRVTHLPGVTSRDEDARTGLVETVPRSPSRVGPRREVAGRVAWAAAAAALLLAFGVGEYARRATNPVVTPTATMAVREVTTSVGETAALRFSDGTEIRLAPTSRLRYPADMLGTSRDLDLDGEAYIAVGTRGNAPLRVRTALGTMRDVGTRFVVRALPNRALEVAVVDGLVSLRAGASEPPRGEAVSTRRLMPVNDSVLVTPGTLGSIAKDGRLRPVRRVRIDAYTAWLDGRLVFADAPLGDVLATLARWRAVDYRFASAELADRRFTGAFEREPTDDMLAVIALTANVRFDVRGGTLVVRDDTTRRTHDARRPTPRS